MVSRQPSSNDSYALLDLEQYSYVSEYDKLTILLASMASASDNAVAPLLVLVSLTAEWSPLLADMGSGGGISLDTSLGKAVAALETEARKGLAPLTLTTEQDATLGYAASHSSGSSTESKIHNNTQGLRKRNAYVRPSSARLY